MADHIAIGQPAGYQNLSAATLAAGATGLTLPTAWPTGVVGSDGTTKFTGVKGILITVSTATVWYRDDGVAPTTSAGHGVPLAAGTIKWYSGNFAAIRFISSTGVLDVSYYG